MNNPKNNLKKPVKLIKSTPAPATPVAQPEHVEVLPYSDFVQELTSGDSRADNGSGVRRY